MEFHVEVCQASKLRGAKPVITSKAHHLSQMHQDRIITGSKWRGAKPIITSKANHLNHMYMTR